MSKRRRWRAALDVAAASVMLLAGITLIAAVLTRPVSQPEEAIRPIPRQPPEETRVVRQLPVAPMPLEGVALKGTPDAKVGVIEYSDFECPYCGAFAIETLPRIAQSYIDTGKIRFGFRHLPIELRHPRALKAAEAAECAGQQDRFWELHNLLFAPPRRLDYEDLVQKARRVGVDERQFIECLSGQMTGKVRRDISQAQALSVAATPTFFFATSRMGTCV
jgi:protein-disulfide isomerase